MYDFIIGGTHTFFASTPAGIGILVHNCGGAASAAGRRRSAATRDHLDDVRDELLDANPSWEHLAGGRVRGSGDKLEERAVKSVAGARRFPDLTVRLPEKTYVYVNTVDTSASGAPTIRKSEAAVDITLWGRGPTLMIPKP